MKISDSTLKILKNFNGIAASLVLHSGHNQRTGLRDTHAILALATITEDWPQEVAIFDLSTFLSMVSMFKGPEIDFQPDHMVVSTVAGGVKVKYRYADASLIQVPKVSTLPFDNPGVEFNLPKATFDAVIKQCLTLKLPSVLLGVANGTVTLKGLDAKNALAHAVEFEVPSTDVTVHDPALKLAFPFMVDHLTRLMDGNYKVALSGAWKPYAHFVNQTEPVSYFVVAHTKKDGK